MQHPGRGGGANRLGGVLLNLTKGIFIKPVMNYKRVLLILLLLILNHI